MAMTQLHSIFFCLEERHIKQIRGACAMDNMPQDHEEVIRLRHLGKRRNTMRFLASAARLRTGPPMARMIRAIRGHSGYRRPKSVVLIGSGGKLGQFPGHSKVDTAVLHVGDSYSAGTYGFSGNGVDRPFAHSAGCSRVSAEAELPGFCKSAGDTTWFCAS